MLRPPVKNISNPKKALKVAMVTTIEMMRKPWISQPLSQWKAAKVLLRKELH